MSEHLNQNQLEGLAQRTLPGTELVSLFDHLVVCEPCRQRVEKAMGGDATFLALRSEVLGAAAEVVAPAAGTHLSLEHMAEYVDGMLTGEHLQTAKDHLATCQRCYLEVNDLRAFSGEVAPNLDRTYSPATGYAKSESWKHQLGGFLPSLLQRSPALAFGSAVVLLMLIGIGWLVWQRLEKRETKTELATASPSPTLTPSVTTGAIPTASPTVSPEEPATPVIAELNDGGSRVVLDQAGKLSGVDYLPPAYQRMLKESLTDQRVEKSALLAGLNRPGSPLLSGSDQGDRFSVIEPVGRVLQSNRPTFRWSRLEGAMGYFVEIYDEKFNPVATSSQLTHNSWKSQQSLQPGIYSWQVTAIKAGPREFKAPQPPAPQAKFRILDSATVSELQQARRAYASSHLTLGLLYARAGLLDEAEKEFRALQKANPNSALVRKLLSEVRKLRR